MKTKPSPASPIARGLTRGRWAGVTGALLVLLAVVVVAGTLVGWANIFEPGVSSSQARDIVFEWRVPRVLLAGLVGAALALAGATYQALIRNPLASPYILGIAAGGSFGVALAISLGLQFTLFGFSSDMVFGFLGSLGALVLVMGIARRGSRLPRHTLLLTGVVVNTFFSAGILLIHYLSAHEESQEIVQRLMGYVGWVSLAIPARAAPLILAGSVVTFAFARHLNLISLGEEQAGALGVDVATVRWVLFVVSSVLTGVAVSITGPIGFVGLIVPHIVRLAFGADHRLLLPAAFLSGAAFLIAADAAARAIPTAGEMPVGIVTAMIGGPFFLWLLRQNMRKAIFE